MAPPGPVQTLRTGAVEQSELRVDGILRSSSTARKKTFEKGTYEHSKFIGDSSGVGTNAGLHAHPCAAREGQTRREAGVQCLRALIGRRQKGRWYPEETGLLVETATNRGRHR
jgi:hypothetical protein